MYGCLSIMLVVNAKVEQRVNLYVIFVFGKTHYHESQVLLHFSSP